MVSQRRIELLAEKTATNRHMQAMGSTRGLKENSQQQIGNANNNQASAQNIGPMKQRAFSSTGRT